MKIFVSAGEPSGDQRGAEVLEKLSGICGEDMEAFGLGGDRLALAGMELTRHMSAYAVMGFAEIAASLGRFLELERALAAECRARRPDLALLVDYPGFNMRLGRKLRGMGIPVVHYVAPQMWAWGSWRAGKLRRSCDLLLTLFRFEEEFFRKRGVNAVFTGHPLKGRIQANLEEGELLGLLPGSREQEVRHLLPVMVEAFQDLRREKLVSRGMLAVSSHLDGSVYAGASNVEGLELVQGTDDVLRNSRAALVCSGTATLETALHRVPFVVCYRTGKLTYALARLLVTGVDRIGMANIVAGCDVAPELVQGDVTPGRAVESITPLLLPGEQRRRTMELLEKVRENLGDGDPAGNAAGEILSFAGRTHER